jgi:hypothetical protein
MMMLNEIEDIVRDRIKNTAAWHNLSQVFEEQHLEEALDAVIDQVVDNVYCDLDPMIEGYMNKIGGVQAADLLREYMIENEILEEDDDG